MRFEFDTPGAAKAHAKVHVRLLDVALAASLLFPGLALAQADATAGRAKVEAACAACHGANGVSVTDTIPNLAGQKAAYLEAQLRALKSGARRNAVMNAIATQLSPQEISNVAAFFASLPGASSAATKSAFLPALVKTNATLPANYKTTFTMYQTVNRPDINQVRYLYANDVALRAARDGKSLPDGSLLVLEQHAARLGSDGKPATGSDGFYVAEKFVAYAVMERGNGWGKEIPENLRNEDWHYAAYSPDRQLRPANQAECLACHKPLDKDSYLFSIKALTETAKKR